jgi:hypothetical protein
MCVSEHRRFERAFFMSRLTSNNDRRAAVLSGVDNVSIQRWHPTRANTLWVWHR